MQLSFFNFTEYNPQRTAETLPLIKQGVVFWFRYGCSTYAGVNHATVIFQLYRIQPTKDGGDTSAD
ncbi:putative tail fiber assembly protein [Salmonella phage vB_SalM-LPSEYT]|nr:putative tail fiber assembly protein [Salmonella phage vB_SalM-LPSEYT]